MSSDYIDDIFTRPAFLNDLGASRPASVNEDAVAAAHAAHLDHFMGRVQRRPLDDEKLAELEHEAFSDEEDARREEQELRQWEEDKGARRG